VHAWYSPRMKVGSAAAAATAAAALPRTLGQAGGVTGIVQRGDQRGGVGGAGDAHAAVRQVHFDALHATQGAQRLLDMLGAVAAGHAFNLQFDSGHEKSPRRDGAGRRMVLATVARSSAGDE